MHDDKLQDLEKIDRMNESELDALPFGAIRLDRDGNILSYNMTESKLTGRDPKRVIGRNFFRDVAPCTNVQAFAGRFRDGVAKKEMHAIFPYRFDFQMAPRDVTVTLFYSKQTDTAWVFVREAEASA
ncbi:MAG TPA: photoactive yellow protein [Thermoanaerobaculia bacterium]